MPLGLVANYTDSEGSGDENYDDVPPAVALSGALTADPSTHSSKNKNDDQLEDFVKRVDYGESLPEKPKPISQSSLASIRKKGTKSGKIQITLPEILGSDSDDDEPAKKLPRAVGGGTSGLLGSLPQPKNTVLGKQTNRQLLPQSITKPAKPDDTVKKSHVNSAGKNKPLSKSPLTSNHSDSDDEIETGSRDMNFFSISSAPHTSSASTSYFGLDASSETPKEHSTSPTGKPEYQVQSQPTAASFYNLATEADEDEWPSESADTLAEKNEVSDLLNSEQFLRMQGKKQRGREEVNIIDVNTDDLKATELELTKNLSQDIDPSMYEHRKNMNISGVERRKHQITYLAFQAKERELELKNTWAEGRHTRKQTQAKYGF